MKKYLKFIFLLIIICISLFSISCKSAIASLKETAITEIVAGTTVGSTTETKNNPPEVKELIILPDNPSTSQDLTLTYKFNGINQASDKSTIKWYKNGEHLSDFDNVTIIPKINLNPDDNWYAVVSPYDGKDYGVDVTSDKIIISKGGLKPEILSKIDLLKTLDAITGIAIEDNYAYIAYFDQDENYNIKKSGILIIDIENKKDPKVINNIELDPSVITDMYIKNKNIYINYFLREEGKIVKSGIKTIDISDNENPKIISDIKNKSQNYGLYINGNNAYFIDEKGMLYILDISDSNNINVIKTINIGIKPYYSAWIKDKYIYIYDSGNGDLKVFEISDNEKVLLKYNINSVDIRSTELANTGPAYVYVNNNYLYYVEYFIKDEKENFCIHIIDITEEGNPIKKGKIDFPRVADVYIEGEYAYLPKVDSGIEIIDMTNKEDPVILGTTSSLSVTNIYKKDNYLYTGYVVQNKDWKVLENGLAIYKIYN